MAMACAAFAAVPPTLREADVVVVGGTVDGVRAAIAAKASGASVFLVAPRAYLGEDRAATFQLDRLPSDDPSDPVIREIFNPLYAKPVSLAATLSTNAADAARIVLTADLARRFPSLCARTPRSARTPPTSTRLHAL